ncbi:MAG TPA: hypothetical protein VIM16_07560 [Mucilaginibacter sp.]|jgi:hypothetical protein
MKTENIINDIINLPSKFRDLRDISFYSLLKNTGYFELFDQVNENKILDQLIKNPERIQQWLDYSDDKRTSTGYR